MSFNLLISIISLIVSLTIAWLTWLRPFSARIILGNIYLVSQKGENNLITITLGLQLSIFNKGAREGVLEDLMITMKSVDGNFNSVFFPIYFYDNQQYLENKLNKKSDLFSMKGSYSSLLLSPKQMILKEIMFQMDKNSGILNAGNYIFTFYKKENGKGFLEFTNRKEIIGQSAIDNLYNETITVLMPFIYREDYVKKFIID